MAMTRLPAGPLLACSERAAFLHDTIAETGLGGSRRRGNARRRLSERVMAMSTTYPAWAKASMLVDLEAGRRLELDAITGAVVRRGREYEWPRQPTRRSMRH